MNWRARPLVSYRVIVDLIVNLPRGAQVVPNGSMRSAAPAGGNGGGDVHVQVINNHSSANVTAKPGPMIDGRHSLQVMVEDAMAHSVATNGRGYQAIAKRSGLGRSGY